METLFAARPQPALAVADAVALYPVARIFCIGRNYAAHAEEMGNAVEDTPFFFTKSCHHLAQSGVMQPYPPGTAEYHHEVELVVALGSELTAATADTAMEAVFGYAVGLDMTRRDLQARAKAKSLPWDAAKDAEGSAVIGPLTRAEAFGAPGPQRISLDVNGEIRQDARLDEMVRPVGALLAFLSELYTLAPGDLVMTGTPAGVAAVGPGDVLTGTIEGLSAVQMTVSAD
ncbi:Fumarylpyruvate hydrolase [Roseivivax jejudonensis]|uniref:Fumarylpyruvate hydrolase n=1 Tax=Roseivivax jejudonensis TaxID=1529041 RepID=A0A1X6Z5B3_9RHOB|nr:fumarylacetoacetate hydrolase family protein [Roseivivax jejudonensis]SLN40836.1 Fumarylpyruvate hydrolase [Roseivivax jejudonensis]